MILADFYNYANRKTTTNVNKGFAGTQKRARMAEQKTKNNKKVSTKINEAEIQGLNSSSYLIDLALLIRKARVDRQAHWELFNQLIPMLREKFGAEKTKELFHTAAAKLAESTSR